MTVAARDTLIQQALLRTVAYFDAISYAPTWTECTAWLEWPDATSESVPSSGELVLAREVLMEQGRFAFRQGRVALALRVDELLALVDERSALFPRKVRRAQRVARWLLRNPNVRFVALANTTALAHARDQGDLDFFVIVKQGTIWSTRLLSAGLYKILGRLPGRDGERDAVCLSYFVSDDALDLSSHMLDGDDPYFRTWFLSLLPLMDDGVGADLWKANASITSRHPRAGRWIVPTDLRIERPAVRLGFARWLESAARRFQMRWFPRTIKDRMNRDTAVVVTDQVLKFHVDDGRERYREAYRARLLELGL